MSDSTLTSLLGDVATCPGITASATMLIRGICDRLLEAGTDQDLLSVLHNDLANDATAFATAIINSTAAQGFESTTPVSQGRNDIMEPAFIQPGNG